MNYYLGLGSNLGNRRRNLQRALRLLQKMGKIQKSSLIYRTEPFQMNSQRFFLNQVVEYSTELPPKELLIFLKAVEREIGRDASQGHYSDRLIDLDILFAGSLIIRAELLQVPHPRIAERDFVLRPLAEIAPDFLHPLLKKTVLELLTELTAESSENKN